MPWRRLRRPGPERQWPRKIRKHPRQAFEHIIRSQPPGHIDSKAFAGVFINNHEHPERLAIVGADVEKRFPDIQLEQVAERFPRVRVADYPELQEYSWEECHKGSYGEPPRGHSHASVPEDQAQTQRGDQFHSWVVDRVVDDRADVGAPVRVVDLRKLLEYTTLAVEQLPAWADRPVVVQGHHQRHARPAERLQHAALALTEAGMLREESYTVVGVMPPGFHFPPGEKDIEVWTPLVVSPVMLRVRAMRFYDVVGRLEPGVSKQQAHAELKAITDQMQNGKTTLIEMIPRLPPTFSTVMTDMSAGSVMVRIPLASTDQSRTVGSAGDREAGDGAGGRDGVELAFGALSDRRQPR